MTQGKEKTMLEKRQALIQLRLGNSVRKVSRDLNIHRDIVTAIRVEATKNGWLNPNCDMPSDGEIALLCAGAQSTPHELDPYFDKIKQWRLEGMSAIVIHRLLKNSGLHTCAIGTLRRYIKKNHQRLPDAVMIRETIPGEHMDVDFGYLGMLWDEEQQKMRKIWVFSARLRHSRKCYRELVWKQDGMTFYKAHVHAFEHFNGVPRKVVLDNLKAGVIKSCIDNSQLNRSYVSLAEHYGFMISPCLPRTPQHKGGVENDMKYIQRNFWAEIRERQKTQPKLTLRQSQEALNNWDSEVAGVRQLRGIGRTPEEIFSSCEKMALQPLPEYAWEPVEWFQCTVGRDWRIVCLGSYYSVPYEYIGQTAQVMATSSIVRIFFDNQQVTHHAKSSVKGQYQKSPEHAPPFKDAVLNSSREGLLSNADEIGPHVRKICEKILSNPHVDKLRPVRCLLTLALKYEKERLDKACARALHYNNIGYNCVKEILEKGLDMEEILEHSERIKMNFRFARDPSTYQSSSDKIV
jgi:transposase